MLQALKDYLKREHSALLAFLVAVASLAVAWCQLGQAVDSIKAANAISLSRDGRVIAQKISAANTDAARELAYDEYGDFLAHAGYMHLNDGIPTSIWNFIRKDFCTVYQLDDFKRWWLLNSQLSHFLALYPEYSKLNSTCRTS
jgi:hypothetical protein